MFIKGAVARRAKERPVMMRIQKIQSKQILLLFVTAFLVFLFFSMVFSLKKRGLPVALNRGPEKADVSVKAFSFVQTHEGAKEWELTAERAEVYERDHQAFLEKIAVTIQTPQGWELNLEGDEGTIDTEKKDFFLKKKSEWMAIRLSNGYTIKTPAVRWLNDEKKIVTEGPAHISGPRIEIDGKELTVGVEDQEVTVSGDVQASVY